MLELNRLIELNRAQGATISEDPFAARRYKQFAHRFPDRAQRVLDVGCSTGHGGAVLKALKPGVHLTGLDCVPERASGLPPNIYDASVCAFAHSTPLDSESFDVIVAGEFIEHVSPDMVLPTLCEFFRLLTLKGMLLLTTPNPHYVRNKLKGVSVLQDIAHVSQHPAKSLKRRLQDVGFSQVRIKGSGRVSAFIGEHFPILSVYGSYLARGIKW